MSIISIKRPVGRPSFNQLMVTDALESIGDNIALWLRENKRRASGKSSNFKIELRRRGSGQKGTLPTIEGKLIGTKYLPYALFGRPSGPQPPWPLILKWMKVRSIRGRDLRGRFKSDTQAAKAIAHAIGEFGTQAFEMSPVVYDVIIGRAVRDAIKKFTPLIAEDETTRLVGNFLNDTKDLKNMKVTSTLTL